MYAPGASVARARVRAEVLFELVRHVLPLVGVARSFLLAGNIRPGLGLLPVDLQPFLGGIDLGIGLDRLDRAFRLAHAAVAAFVGGIGRPSGGGRGCQTVYLTVVADAINKKKNK